MTREQYGEKHAKVQEYLHSGDCYQVNLASVFMRPILAMNGRHSFSLIRPTARHLALFYALNRVQF